MGKRGLIHADSAVRDSNPHRARFLPQPYGDGSALRCEFDRVANEIEPQMLQQLFVGRERHIREISVELDILFQPVPGENNRALTQLFAQIVLLNIGDDALGGKLGQQDRIAGQAGKALRLIADDLEILPLFVLGQFF